MLQQRRASAGEDFVDDAMERGSTNNNNNINNVPIAKMKVHATTTTTTTTRNASSVSRLMRKFTLFLVFVAAARLYVMLHQAASKAAAGSLVLGGGGGSENDASAKAAAGVPDAIAVSSTVRALETIGVITPRDLTLRSADELIKALSDAGECATPDVEAVSAWRMRAWEAMGKHPWMSDYTCG